MKLSLTLAAILALSLPATADHCATWSTTSPDVDAGAFYVDNDCGGGPCPLFSIWVYQETNGIPGLQRGDVVVDDTCHGMIAADTIIL